LTDLALVLLFAFFVDVFKHGLPVKLWENFLIILGLVVSLVGISFTIWRQYQWMSITGPRISIIPTGLRLAPLLFVHQNNAAGFINFVIPLCLAGILLANSLRKKIYLFVVGVIFLVYSYLTGSRGGWMGLFAGLLVMAGLIIWQRSKQGNGGESLFDYLRTRLVNRNQLWIKIPALCVAFLFMVTFLYMFAVRGDSHRLELWQNTLRAIMASPLLGRGTNSHPFLIAQIGKTPIDQGVYFHPHNILLKFLEEVGVFGAVILLAGVYFLGKAWWMSWNKAGNKLGDQIFLATYAGGIVATGVQGLVSYTFLNLLFTVSFFLFLAFAFSYAPDSEFILPFNRFYQGLAFLSVIGLGGAYWLTYPTSSLFYQGVQKTLAGDGSGGRDLICAAAQMRPGMTGYAFQCGQALTVAYFQGGNVGDLQRAADMVGNALHQDGYFFMNWMEYAAIQWRLGDKEAALQSMRQAANLAPEWAIVQLNLGWMEEQVGDQGEAIQAYLRAGCLDPSYQISLVYQKSQYYDLIRNDACSAVPQNADPAAYPLILASYESLGQMDLRTATSRLSWRTCRQRT
jgi:O-antigen ligase